MKSLAWRLLALTPFRRMVSAASIVIRVSAGFVEDAATC